MTAGSDVLVIGAGVVGCAIARHLLDLAVGSVTVVERDHVASGMSGRSSALVRMHYTLPEEVLLTLRSVEMFENWKELTGQDSSFHPVGFIQIVGPDEKHLLEQNVAMQRSLGVEVELLTADELARLEPEWAVSDVSYVAYEPGSGYGDGSTVAADLLSSARSLGAKYLPRTEIRKLLRRGERIVGAVTGKGEVLHANVVVCATGVWSPVLLAEVGVRLPIDVELHHTVVLKAPAGVGSPKVACIDNVTRTYFRPLPPDMTIVGDFTGTRGVDIDAIPTGPDASSLERTLAGVSHRIPRYADAGIVRTVTGAYDMTPDRRPLLGPAPGIEGLYVAVGMSGQGFKTSPALGRCVAEWIVEGRPSLVDVSQLRATRFESGNRIVAPYEYPMT